jgi:FAD:protein FMN transferase
MICQASAQCQPRVRAKDFLVRRARPLMGTLVSIAARDDNPNTLEDGIRRAFAEMERLAALLSEWRPDSAVSRVNLAAGEAPIPVPIELIEVMETAGKVFHATDGTFDATWASLSRIWTFDAPEFRPPTADAVAAARNLVDFRDVVIDRQRQTIFLRRRGMRLGLGGIAKAYIAERGADFAVASGLSHILVDAGGDLVARGRNGGRPWTVGVRDPRSNAKLLATVELCEESVATSGDYERFVDVDGQRYHHLLDPRTGVPASASRSATVVAPQGAMAEALSTALFVLGPRALKGFPAFADTAALLVDSEGVVHTTANGTARFRQVVEEECGRYGSSPRRRSGIA